MHLIISGFDFLFKSLSIADDMAQLKAATEALRLKTAEEDIFDIVAVLEEHIAGCSKELWFLHSMMAYDFFIIDEQKQQLPTDNRY